MDGYLLLHQLTLETKLNYLCISLAKLVVSRGIRLGTSRTDIHTFPGEDRAVFIDNAKLTSNLGKSLRYGEVNICNATNTIVMVSQCAILNR